MFTTLSPCIACCGNVILRKIPRVVIGENETFLGAEDLLRSHGVEVINLDLDECKAMMRRFIAEKPEIWLNDITEDTSETKTSDTKPSD